MLVLVDKRKLMLERPKPAICNYRAGKVSLLVDVTPSQSCSTHFEQGIVVRPQALKLCIRMPELAMVWNEWR